MCRGRGGPEGHRVRRGRRLLSTVSCRAATSLAQCLRAGVPIGGWGVRLPTPATRRSSSPAGSRRAIEQGRRTRLGWIPRLLGTPPPRRAGTLASQTRPDPTRRRTGLGCAGLEGIQRQASGGRAGPPALAARAGLAPTFELSSIGRETRPPLDCSRGIGAGRGGPGRRTVALVNSAAGPIAGRPIGGAGRGGRYSQGKVTDGVVGTAAPGACPTRNMPS